MNADPENPDVPPTLGEQELDVLRFISDRAPVTVRLVADEWGQPRGLAKTTVQTVMERLRGKGYLTRAKRYGSYEYSPSVAKNVLLRQLVHDFVERVLGGSFSPLVNYLAERRNLTESELEVLERFAEETEAADNAPTPEKKSPDEGESAKP